MIPFVDLVLNFDHYLPEIIQAYGLLTYVLLVAIIFLESALVIFPFLPGDSLLFISGALSATGLLNPELLIVLLIIAALIGGVVNFLIGRYLGQKILDKKIGFFRQEYIDKTHMFFEKYGGFTIVIARFVPFVRSFAPFFAGLGQMNFYHFFLYNIIGAVLWIMSFTLAGYFFGNLPVVKDNFSLVIILIVGLSLIGVLSIVLNMFREFKITDILGKEKKD
ncbi:MAG: VTT domain-containing protein [Methanomicrobiales archaeon]|nr:VTT domain-containing protein [Methanomicrobiales archaeon]